MDSPDDLIVPVYLNQRMVFDFVSTLQGGLAEVPKVSEASKLAGEAAIEAGGAFGLSKVLSSLLRIDFSGKASAKGAGEATLTRNEDRIHTPASLFMHLRRLLRSKQWLQSDSASFQPKSGDLIEFSAQMRPNPFIEMLDTFLEIAEMTQLFTVQSGKGKAATGDSQRTKKQMQGMSAALKGGTTSDLITAPLKSKYRCIITLENQYLNDPSMSDLADGTFRVVGKVIRAISGDQEAISLNRKTAFGSLPVPVLQQMQLALQSAELKAMRLPHFEWEVPGPVIQVLPVAIFA